MIKIYLNGKENKIQKKQTINDLLDSQGLKEKMIAVAINMKIIHKKDYDKTIIMEEDKIEIVKPVGGG
ncbi:MAG: sulfur carrier protein ThiS [SAR202 cluster bacterium]|nr:sulfur carrier protein ThiS [SAR202 cluster bacterium]|tara:strand:- start:233 stop:436 length:204 start_codon:yes stop_codon:yes gene_type:complete